MRDRQLSWDVRDGLVERVTFEKRFKEESSSIDTYLREKEPGEGKWQTLRR